MDGGEHIAVHIHLEPIGYAIAFLYVGACFGELAPLVEAADVARITADWHFVPRWEREG